MELKSAKKEMFCQQYLIDLNKTQAYIRAGYSEHSAAQGAERLFRNVDVAARIKELLAERVEKLNIDQEWVLLRLLQISDRAMQAEEVMKFDYASKTIKGTGEYVFDSNGANKATELIGKHLGMFRDKIDITNQTAPDLKNLSGSEKLAYLELMKKMRGEG